jgi:O-acetylhomoserine/O-acetylserine sulfhydrylase-like pyridoxal-dependent enzyme
MKITTEILIDKPAAAVWEVLGTQFGAAFLWASILNHTEGHGQKISGQVCESRTCDIQGMGRTIEKLTAFDPAAHALTYQVMEGFPFFVERGVNRWRLAEEGGRTRVVSDAEIVTKGVIGVLMGPMMKMQMSGMMRRTLEDLKYYVERGVPHPRKQKAMATGRLARA